MLAAQDGNEDVVQALLDRGANPQTCTPDGRNAVQFAREQGHETVVQALQQPRCAAADPATSHMSAQRVEQDHEFIGDHGHLALQGAAVPMDVDAPPAYEDMEVMAVGLSDAGAAQ
jgi:ankyrin repeat protein